MPESLSFLAQLAPYVGQLAAIAACFLLLAFSSLSEAALMRMELGRATHLAEEGRWGARRLVHLLQHRQEVLSSLVLLINLSIIVSSAYATEVTIRLSGDGHRWVPLVSIAMILFILVFCEVTPKTYALRRAEAVGLAAAPLITLTHKLVSPVGRLLHLIAVWFNRRVLVPIIGGQAVASWPSYTDEEVMALVAAGEAEGDIEAEEREMIAGVIEFADKVAREVMTPRTDIVCVPAHMTLAEAARVSAESGYSRLPVYEGGVDDIIGILYAKDMVSAIETGGPDLAAAQVARRPAPVVPESKKAAEVLHLMQRRRLHMAVVIDEYGGTAGLVTIEDLLEEIFGEIQDEYDAEAEPIITVDDTTTLFDARVSVAEVEDRLGVSLPEGEFDSIGGFILDQLGRLPAPGETVGWTSRADEIHLEFTAEQVAENRIRRVRVVRTPLEPSDEGPPPDAD